MIGIDFSFNLIMSIKLLKFHKDLSPPPCSSSTGLQFFFDKAIDLAMDCTIEKLGFMPLQVHI